MFESRVSSVLSNLCCTAAQQRHDFRAVDSQHAIEAQPNASWTSHTCENQHVATSTQSIQAQGTGFPFDTADTHETHATRSTSAINISTLDSVWSMIRQAMIETSLPVSHSQFQQAVAWMLNLGAAPNMIYAVILGEVASLHSNPAEFCTRHAEYMKVGIVHPCLVS